VQRNARSISLPLLGLWQYYLVAMATSLDKLENMVQIHHLHVKCFHMVKRLQKSVQYIRRYSTIYASFWACHTRRTQIGLSPVIYGVTRQKFTKFLDDVAQSSPLLTCTARPWYCNTNASGISRLDVDNIFATFFGCHDNVPRKIGKWSTDPPSARRALSYGEQIAKIGPVYPEIFD